MALPGETGHIGKSCPDCKQPLYLEILQSGAGFYIGTRCDCGPYSRESGYYPSREAAQKALDNFEVDWR